MSSTGGAPAPSGSSGGGWKVVVLEFLKGLVVPFLKLVGIVLLIVGLVCGLGIAGSHCSSYIQKDEQEAQAKKTEDEYKGPNTFTASRKRDEAERAAAPVKPMWATPTPTSHGYVSQGWTWGENKAYGAANSAEKAWEESEELRQTLWWRFCIFVVVVLAIPAIGDWAKKLEIVGEMAALLVCAWFLYAWTWKVPALPTMSDRVEWLLPRTHEQGWWIVGCMVLPALCYVIELVRNPELKRKGWFLWLALLVPQFVMLGFTVKEVLAQAWTWGLLGKIVGVVIVVVVLRAIMMYAARKFTGGGDDHDGGHLFFVTLA